MFYVKLLTEHHLEFRSLKDGCRGSSESTQVKVHIFGNLMHWAHIGLHLLTVVIVWWNVVIKLLRDVINEFCSENTEINMCEHQGNL